MLLQFLLQQMVKTIAERFFDLDIKVGVLETELEDALITAMGVDMSADPKEWNFPFKNWCFDWYDSSFELRDTKVGWEPTPEQLKAAFDLGFARCWICYTDGTERYAAIDVPLGCGKKSHYSGLGSDIPIRTKRLEKMLRDKEKT